MGKIFDKLKAAYWEFPIIPSSMKDDIFYGIRKMVRGSVKKESSHEVFESYVNSMLKKQLPSDSYEELEKQNFLRCDDDTKLLAYYLPQFYPTPYNDKWWGKGTTEWRNVSKGMPQYVGHYQPRFPGELGYYDLRLIENIERQVELAKKSGIYGFCFYYYWFDGTRLLDKPVDMFVESKIEFPFCFCWANENWSKQWFGTSDEPLIVQSKTSESYKKFIESIEVYIKDSRYMTVNHKKVLVIYRPKSIPDTANTLKYWRDYIKNKTGYELYIIAAMNDTYESYRESDFLSVGFDAISEFCLGPQRKYFSDIKNNKKFVCDEFLGNVYDYRDFVVNKKYFSESLPKLYRAITPMWDNSARKVNKGIILDGSTPELYRMWLEDIMMETKVNKERNKIDDNLIFINAWNEWSEGAYLEPDLKYGYGYLNATLQAMINLRDKKYVAQKK